MKKLILILFFCLCTSGAYIPRGLVVSKTTTYTLSPADGLVLCDTSGAGFTVNLPAAAGLTGISFCIMKTSSDGNTLTIDGSGAETINGAATKAITGQYASAVILSNGTGWVITSEATSTAYQPVDSDLTAISALTTTAHGRGLLDDADAAASRASIGAVIGTDVQAYDADLPIGSIGITIDGGGSAITTGQKGYVSIPYACTINSATILLDQSGSIVIDVWKDAYANYPPTVADTITAAAKPTVSGAVKSQDTTLTGWTTSVSAGDVIGFNVDSITTATRATLILKVTK